MLNTAKNRTLEQRQRKVPVKHRTRQYITFIDLKKAFDKVNRYKLVLELNKMGISPKLTVIIKNLLSNTTGTIGNEIIATTTGVPQGGVLSPTLFNLYINSLLVELANNGVKTLAFADDIVFVSNGDRELFKAIEIAKKWSTQSEIEINFTKSAIMIIRPDKRTKWPNIKTIKGIPVVEQYQYLGITMDDSGSFKPLK